MFLPVDLAGTKPLTDLTFPPGDYLLEITKVESIQTKKEGRPLFQTHNKVIMVSPGIDEDTVGAPIRGGYLLDIDMGKRSLMRLIVACGFHESQINQHFDMNQLVGKQYVAQIGERNGFPNLSRERPASEWAGGVAGAPAGAPMNQAPQSSLLQNVAQPAQPEQVQQAQAAAAPPQQQVQQAPPQPQQAPPTQAATQQQAAAAPPAFAAPPPPPSQVGGQ